MGGVVRRGPFDEAQDRLRQAQAERDFKWNSKGPLMLSLSKHFALAGLLALTSCSAPDTEAPPGETVDCALDGAAEFAPVCGVEREIVPGGTILVIRHPDGGFRRFEIEGDLVRTADGAETVTVIPSADATEVAVGNDRYRLAPPAPPVDAAPDQDGR